jgi:ParB family chromosome partitioning protein
MPAKKHSGLGRGLQNLFPAEVEVPVKTGDGAREKSSGQGQNVQKQHTEKAESAGIDEVLSVRITSIEPNRSQPRKKFDEDALKELSDSIRQHGLIQPILVQTRGSRYEIVAGERRWRAAKLAGLKELPVIVRNYTEQEIAEISLIENLQREDLNPIEEAMAFRSLIEEYSLRQEDVAERVSKSRAAVTNSMRLLKLSPKVQEYVVNGDLSAGHARALLAVEDPAGQEAAADKIVSGKLSVREAERLVKALNKTKTVPRKKDEQLEAILRDLEEKIRHSLGTNAAIVPKGKKGGKIEIEYYSNDDLDRIIERLI